MVLSLSVLTEWQVPRFDSYLKWSASVHPPNWGCGPFLGVVPETTSILKRSQIRLRRSVAPNLNHKTAGGT